MTYCHEHVGHLLAQMVVNTAAQRTSRLIGDVIEAEHSGQRALVRDDWQAPNRVCRASRPLRRSARRPFGSIRTRHCALNPQFVQGLATRVRRHADITISQKSDWLELSVHHRDAAAAVLPHYFGRAIQRVFRMARFDRPIHHLFDFH
jgi:hypothetical protein